jgi:hypothetical protein
VRYLVALFLLVLLTGCLTKEDCWDATQIANAMLTICSGSYGEDPACTKGVNEQVKKATEICRKTGGAF